MAQGAKPQTPNPSEQTTTTLAETVRQRAYELYEARGREDGHDVEDWLQAEAELAAAKSKTQAA